MAGGKDGRGEKRKEAEQRGEDGKVGKLGGKEYGKENERRDDEEGA